MEMAGAGKPEDRPMWKWWSRGCFYITRTLLYRARARLSVLPEDLLVFWCSTDVYSYLKGVHTDL